MDRLRFLEVRGVDPDMFDAVEDDGTNEAVDELVNSDSPSLSLARLDPVAPHDQVICGNWCTGGIDYHR